MIAIQILLLGLASLCITIAVSALIVGYIEDRPDSILSKMWNCGFMGQAIFIVILGTLLLLII